MERKELRVKYPLLSTKQVAKGLGYKWIRPEDVRRVELGACHSEMFHYPNDILKTEFFHQIREGYTDQDIVTWAAFMTACGFPSSFVNDAEGRWIKLLGSEYTSKSHFLAGVTGIRYINYSYCLSYSEIPNLALDVYNNTTLSPYQALMIGHFMAINSGFWDCSHGMIYGIGYALPEEKVKENYAKNNSVNICFNRSNDTAKVEFRAALPFYQSKKYEEFEEQLIKNNII